MENRGRDGYLCGQGTGNGYALSLGTNLAELPFPSELGKGEVPKVWLAIVSVRIGFCLRYPKK